MTGSMRAWIFPTKFTLARRTVFIAAQTGGILGKILPTESILMLGRMQGNELRLGVYFYQLRTGKFYATRKLTLMKVKRMQHAEAV